MEDLPEDLRNTLTLVRPLDAEAVEEARQRQSRLTKPQGALGRLEDLSVQLAGLAGTCRPPIPEPATVAIFAADHGVHAQGVTPWPQEVTAQMVANFLAGGAAVNALAAQAGARVVVVDVGVAGEVPVAPGLITCRVRNGTADLSVGPAMSRDEAIAALRVGMVTAQALISLGNRCLLTGDMGIANTTASAALVATFTGRSPREVTGRGTGIDDATWEHKVAVVERALRVNEVDPADPVGALAAVGGLEHAATVGYLLGAAVARVPVVLDGVIAGASALVASALAPDVLASCIAGHRSVEPGHAAALSTLGLQPLLDLGLRLGEGTGAVLALPIVQAAARALRDMATFDSAGVAAKAEGEGDPEADPEADPVADPEAGRTAGG